MTRPAAWAHTLLILALSLWLGVTLMTGAAAGMTFPTVKSLNPSLPEYEGYPNEKGSHGVILGGHIVNKLFLVNDAVQFACASICIIATIVTVISIRRRSGSISRRFMARAGLLGLAVAFVCYELFVLGPRMGANIAKFWEQARAGNIPAANAARDAFDADHPSATTVLAATAFAVLLTLLLAAWPDAQIAGASAATRPAPTPKPPATKREEPALLKGSRR